MKELSIEEKARRYDEAIDVCRKLYNKAKADGYTSDIEDYEDIFPELAESEDERIRKELIEQVVYIIPNDDEVDSEGNILPTYQKRIDKYIAWLEKQGEHANFKNKIQIGDKVTRNEDGVLVNLSQLNRVAKKNEKQSEQKSDDKVEPKFKVGDWIVFNGLTLYIKEIVKGYYGTISKGGITNSYDWDIDNAARLWTIQDAKDGDVLCTYECCEPKIVFILKGTPKKPYVLGYHCYYNIMYPSFETDEEKGCLAPKAEDIKPATKEQRDQLEKAMADAGYTFDFEKKELKKIEQKHKSNIVPIFKEGDIIKNKKNGDTVKVEQILSGSYCYSGWDGAATIHSDFLISDQGNWELVKQKPTEPTLDIEIPFGAKDSELIGESITIPDGCHAVIEGNKVVICKGEKPAWSEEDEKMWNDVISIVEGSVHPRFYDEVVSWLKSLKDRVQPQPKQEWSEEDEKMIQRLKYIIYTHGEVNEKESEDINDWINSLRPQNRWKSSEEQMNAIQEAIGIVGCNTKRGTLLKELYNDLNEL